MKVFNLRCRADHQFEGWFATRPEFDRQRDEGLIRCPVCDSAEISLLPSAPRLNLSAAAATVDESAARAVQARWLEALRTVVSQADNVGARFAEEARKIHYAQAEERPIRGTATPEERRELAEEGIEVLALPEALLNKESLQ